MDANHFDHLAQSLSTTPRRGLLRLLAILPLGGGLASLLDPEEAIADGRRKRRKKRHKHGRGRRRQHHKGQHKKHKKKRTCAGDVCASGCSYTSIQAAIDDPDGPTTIRLCAETYPGTITIAKDLTLIGVGDGEDGTILDGQQNDSVVIVTSGAIVELEGLRITGGSSDDDGGGIDNIGSSVTLTDSSVTGNVAADFGGGIRNSDGTVTLNGTSSVTGNTATDGDGGGIDNTGGGTVTLTDSSSVTENTAGFEGGGIYNASSGAVTLNDDSRVTENTPDDCAGPGAFSGNDCGQ